MKPFSVDALLNFEDSSSDSGNKLITLKFLIFPLIDEDFRSYMESQTFEILTPLPTVQWLNENVKRALNLHR
jgi:hypothetical protein